MVCHVHPPSTLQEFLEEVAALGRAGKISRRGLPKRPDALVHAGRIILRHRSMMRLRPVPWPSLRRRRTA